MNESLQSFLQALFFVSRSPSTGMKRFVFMRPLRPERSLRRKSLLRPFGRDDRRRVGEMLERFGIADLGERSIRELSGGQWQRTLLARALVGNPDLLLLDEPDTHLDEEGKTFLRHLLETEAGQRTIVLVSHEPAFLPAVPGLRTLTAGGGTVVEA